MRALVAKYSTCNCPAYFFPHRRGGGLCREGSGEKMNAVLWGDGGEREAGDDVQGAGLEDGAQV